ncbi:tripartite tricarboxylate transporter substrate binding protein [Roseomonas indoligenes]|uniref:Tripartite tricarboxylate transporter substrate binding protein n=1 Tax=Roseomonas indoligenes TaxID=2820811 RepID=A0A940N0C6_9PROT|nr:tripartite tricarboxylate transporter substrate binding protein [Pararoseomonas indoligenes]MBP0495531.1 tripartite tricarboxylate transporter substrate binding protein [Pararoseomonas indoligenes]
MRPLRRRALLAGPGTIALARGARAAGPWPDGPVRVIVPFAAGGPTDTVARLLARELQSRIGTGFPVENRAGAGGNIGIAAAARAAPDGQTLLVVSNALAINPALYPNAAFDVRRDFVPVTRAVVSPNIIVAGPGKGLRDLAGLIAAAQGRPGGLTYSTPGIGTSPHLTAELLRQRTGAELVHVPYSGAAPAMQALLGGQVDLSFSALPQALPSVQSGALVALAVTGPARWPALPDVPTLAEAGVAGVVVDTFQALLAPAATPPAIVARLHAAAAEALSVPATREALLRQGYEVVADSPADFAAHLDGQLTLWADVVRRGGIRGE